MKQTSTKDFLRLVIDRDDSRPKMRGIYLITDQGDRILERVEAAIDGGVDVLQYRSKIHDPVDVVPLGMELKTRCRDAGVTFIVNDDPALARQLDADGVHLGQEDGDPAAARELLGQEKLIGVSTHNLEEARKAEKAGADYIGFGAMYPTRSKEVSCLPGPETLADVRPYVSVPIVAIGGINRDNACRVIDAGADAIATISAVLDSPDPALAAAELSLLFNRQHPFPRGGVMTVAGSDSGGGAGIQADLKTITLLGSYGSSALTALTAQNTRGVTCIHPVPPSFVEEQMRAVLTDIPVDVVKTGMLYSAEIIEMVATVLDNFGRRMLVVDPVMMAKGGAKLIDRKAVETLRDFLLPRTYLLTPNIPEAELLAGVPVKDEAGMEEAARLLHEAGVRNVLIKGGHLPEGNSVDILYDGSNFLRFPAARIMTKNTHGTGCTLSSAIAAFLAQGEPLPVAVSRAKEFLTSAIRLSQPLGKGHGPVNHFLASREPGDR